VGDILVLVRSLDFSSKCNGIGLVPVSLGPPGTKSRLLTVMKKITEHRTFEASHKQEENYGGVIMGYRHGGI
jgi:hypothetical protein